MPQETVEERAKRLGLTQETVEQRARRLGIAAAPTGHAGKPFVDAPEIVNQRTANDASPTELTQHNGKPFVNASTDAPDVGDKVLGTVASLGREIPGVEFAQAGLRSLGRNGGSYREELGNIRTAEDAAPAWATAPARAAGGAISALALPGGRVIQAGLHGALTGLGEADPDRTLKERVDDAGVRGAVEAGTAGLAEIGSRVPVGAIAKTVMHPRLALARLIRGAISDATAPVAEQAAASEAAPVLSTLGRNRGEPLPLFRGEPLKLVSDAEPAAADVVEASDPILAPTRHRTKAQFEAFAQRMAEAKQAGRIP